MPLKDVQLLLEGYDLEQRKTFPLSHVESIFVHFLPSHYDIDGHQKILLNYVKRPTYRLSDYISLKPQIGSISSIEIDGFEPLTFLELSHEEREKEATRLIRDGLMKVADRNATSKEPIEEAYKKTLESQFTITWIHKKTSKSRKDRKYRADTIFQMDRNGTTVRVEFRHQKKLIDSITTVENGHWLSIWYEYWDAKWQEEELAISNRVNQKVLRFRIIDEKMVEQIAAGNCGQAPSL